MPTEPVPIERVEKMNIVLVNLNQQAEFVPRHNLYVMEIDHKRNKVLFSRRY